MSQQAAPPPSLLCLLGPGAGGLGVQCLRAESIWRGGWRPEDHPPDCGAGPGSEEGARGWTSEEWSKAEAPERGAVAISDQPGSVFMQQSCVLFFSCCGAPG